MRLTLEQGEIALPEDFSFQVESVHPFFSDEGTASVPVTLPASSENLDLLGHPENIHNSKRHIRIYEAFLQSGIFQKRCRLISESAGVKAGITASIALQESEMYADLQDRTLRDIFAAKAFVATRTFPADATGIYNGEFRNMDYLYDVALFPVASDKDSDGNVSIINQPLNGSINDEARTVTVNGKTISAPEGYGVSPFLYLWAMIEYTFSLSGYSIGTNAFKEDPVLKEIVVVNNCADTCLFGGDGGSFGFNYSDLVPSITVGELIVFLHDTFGAFITYETGRIDVRLVRDIFSAEPDMDLTDYERTGRTISYPEQKSFEHSMDTSIDSASPAAETLGKLRAAHEKLAETETVESITGAGLFYIPVLGKYYYKATADSQKTMLGSDCFRYARELDMETEAISSDSRFLPMVKTGSGYMPYIGERIHKYIEVDGKDTDADQPIQLCYAHFLEDVNSEGEMEDSHFCGSSYSYYEDGSEATYRVRDGQTIRLMKYPALTPEGLHVFWEMYASLLADGAPEIETTLDLPLEILSSLDRYTVKYMAGCKVLMKSLKYSIGEPGISGVEVILQLLPSYSDEIVPPEIVFDSAYVWSVRSTRSVFAGNGYEILETDGLTDYTQTDAPVEKPTIAGVKTKYRTRWLKYKYTEKHKSWFGWSTSTRTGTHKWEEYFIAEAQGS